MSIYIYKYYIYKYLYNVYTFWDVNLYKPISIFSETMP